MDDQGLLLVCTSCGARFEKGRHICNECGGPLSSHALTDPVLGIESRGFAAHVAATNPKSLTVVIGMWIWMVPMFVFGVWTTVGSLFWTVEELREGSFFALVGIVLVGFGLLFIWISTTLLVRTTQSYLRQRQESKHASEEEAEECIACGAPLLSGANLCQQCGFSYAEIEDE